MDIQKVYIIGSNEIFKGVKMVFDTERLEIESKFIAARKCRREAYERVYQQKTYCSKPELECMYRAAVPDRNGYQCMNIDKIGLWRYQKDDKDLEGKI